MVDFDHAAEKSSQGWRLAGQGAGNDSPGITFGCNPDKR
jgi:hypothetical protein